MPVPQLEAGQLPQGRWNCTPSEVEAAFVSEGSSREPIWNDWITLTATMRRIVGYLPSVWMSGSFFTDKPVPGDIDCVYLVDTVDFQRALGPRDADSQLLWAIANSRSKGVLGLNVDSYVLEWAPSGGAALSTPVYYKYRGYWDDLWVRVKDPDPRLDSIPRRGYLEVTLDGYR